MDPWQSRPVSDNAPRERTINDIWGPFWGLHDILSEGKNTLTLMGSMKYCHSN